MKILIASLFVLNCLSAERYALFCGKSHPDLAEAICGQFELEEGAQNQNVYLIQTLCPSKCHSINDTLMELYTLAREAKRSSCRKITAIISNCCDSLNMEDAAHLLESAGVNRVVCVDMRGCHYFKKAAIDNLSAASLLAPYFAEKRLVDPVIVGEKGEAFQKRLEECGVKANLASDFVGDLRGKDLIFVEDLVSMPELLDVAEKYVKLDVRKIYACVTHSPFSGAEMEELGRSPFDEVVVTDTLPLKGERPANVTCVSMAPLLAEAIVRIETNRSLEELHGK